MRFTTFSFQNFRGIEKLEFNITDKENPMCLLGLNESGKTTTLHAISIFGRLVQGGQLDDKERLSLRPKGTDFTGKIVLKGFLEFEKEDREAMKNTEILNACIQIDKLKKASRSFYYEFENNKFERLKNDIGDVPWNTDCDEKAKQKARKALCTFIQDKAPDVLYYDDFVFDVPDTISFNGTSNDVKKNDEWKNILNDVYLSTLKDRQASQENLFETEVVKWLDNNSEDRNTVESRVLQMSNVLNGIITCKWRDISKEKSSFEGIEIREEDKFKKFRIVLQSTSNIYKVHERSKGFRWFFTFLILTEFRKHRNKNTIFLLDEPASNLHASAQEQIKISLQNLCKDATVIYSTHSPYLLNSENIENIYLSKNEASEYEEPKIVCRPIETQEEDIEENPEETLKYIKPLLDHIAFILPQILAEPEIVEFVKENKSASKKDAKQLLEKIKPLVAKVYPTGKAWMKKLPENIFIAYVLRIIFGTFLG